MKKKILIAGESWVSTTTHVKGADYFVTSVYEEGVEYLRNALEKAGYEVTFMPNHLAVDHLPYHTEEYQEYAAVILSDIGSNTLLLPSATFSRSEIRPNRCQALRDYVLNGGALLMVGGYMSFAGIDGKARYGATEIADVLPVICLDGDDRREHSEGLHAHVLMPDHPALSGVEGEWPALLGYNKTIMKDGCELLATIGDDPLIAVGSFGKGKGGIFSSDCSPHWAPPAFVGWEYYDILWKSLLDYLTLSED